MGGGRAPAQLKNWLMAFCASCSRLRSKVCKLQCLVPFVQHAEHAGARSWHSSRSLCVPCRCINVLLELIQTKVNYVVQESIIVIKDIFRCGRVLSGCACACVCVCPPCPLGVARVWAAHSNIQCSEHAGARSTSNLDFLPVCPPPGATPTGTRASSARCATRWRAWTSRRPRPP